MAAADSPAVAPDNDHDMFRVSHLCHQLLVAPLMYCGSYIFYTVVCMSKLCAGIVLGLLICLPFNYLL